MPVLEIPPPPKTCPRCGREVRVTLAGVYARCSSMHVIKFNRDTGKWEV